MKRDVHEKTSLFRDLLGAGFFFVLGSTVGEPKVAIIIVACILGVILVATGISAILMLLGYSISEKRRGKKKD